MKLRRHPPLRNSAQLSLFAWADQQELSVPYPVRYLTKRYGICARRARLISELAGLGASK